MLTKEEENTIVFPFTTPLKHSKIVFILAVVAASFRYKNNIKK